MSAADAVPDVSPDLPSRPWRLTLALVERLPQAALSRTLGTLADTPLPTWLRRPVIGGFARMLAIDTTEAEHPVTAYRSLNEFFVRRLRQGVRAWPHDGSTIVSPVDGVIGRLGTVSAGRLVQAKGRYYTAAGLLAGADDAARYDDGTFVTLYLSPRHYHRIHAPCAGTIAGAAHVPGALLPVNRQAVLHVPDLFPKNERVICTIDGALGRTAVVAVGAYNVGRISTAFDSHWAGPGGTVANRKPAVASRRRYDPPIVVGQGDEIMAFHLGSTVVMLSEPGPVCVAPEQGREVRLGNVLLRRR
ncbi:MAG: archaetidylserine decarboxylase [Gemmatimonadota bacterium]